MSQPVKDLQGASSRTDALLATGAPRVPGQADKQIYDDLFIEAMRLVDGGWALRTACQELCPAGVGLDAFYMAMRRREVKDRVDSLQLLTTRKAAALLQVSAESLKGLMAREGFCQVDLGAQSKRWKARDVAALIERRSNASTVQKK